MAKAKQKTSKPHKITVTALGVFGYLSLLLQWLWVGALYLPMLLDSDLRGLLLPAQQSQAQPETHALNVGGSEILWLVMGILVTVIVLGITVIILARIPMAIAKTGNKVSEAMAEATLPIVTHHRKLSVKQQRKLTAKLMAYTKFSLTLLPPIALVGIWFTPFDLPNDIVIFVSAFFALGTTIWFTLQYLFARLLHVPLEEVI